MINGLVVTRPKICLRLPFAATSEACKVFRWEGWLGWRFFWWKCSLGRLGSGELPLEHLLVLPPLEKDHQGNPVCLSITFLSHWVMRDGFFLEYVFSMKVPLEIQSPERGWFGLVWRNNVNFSKVRRISGMVENDITHAPGYKVCPSRDGGPDPALCKSSRSLSWDLRKTRVNTTSDLYWAGVKTVFSAKCEVYVWRLRGSNYCLPLCN